MDSIEQALVNIEKLMVKLFNAKDIKPILAFFSKNFVGFSSTKHERITNLSQLKKTFEYYLKEGDSVHYTIKNVKVKIYGEAALTTFYWQVDIKKKNKTKSITGRATHVFLYEGDTWKIAHEHFSKTH